MGFESDNDRYEELRQMVVSVASLVSKQTEALGKLVEMNRDLSNRILHCLDVAFLSGRKSLHILEFIERSNLPLSASARQDLTDIIAESKKADEQLNAIIMEAKTKYIPLLPPVPPPPPYPMN